MERCLVCGKMSKTKEFIWENEKQVMKKICINPKCKSYAPFIQYKIGEK